MQSKDELLRAAQRAVSMRRQRAIMTARTNQQRVREEIPGYAAAEDTISQAGYKAAHLAATGHSSEKIEAALAESEAAQSRFRAAFARKRLERGRFAAAVYLPPVR